MISTEIFHVLLRRTSNSQPSIQQPSELTNLPVIYLGCICMCGGGGGGGMSWCYGSLGHKTLELPRSL